MASLAANYYLKFALKYLKNVCLSLLTLALLVISAHSLEQIFAGTASVFGRAWESLCRRMLILP